MTFGAVTLPKVKLATVSDEKNNRLNFIISQILSQKHSKYLLVCLLILKIRLHLNVSVVLLFVILLILLSCYSPSIFRIS